MDKQKGEEETEGAYKRWEESPDQNVVTQKWTTLKHNVVIFPPLYQPLPSNIKIVQQQTHRPPPGI
ncbi:hypothetical protein BJV77DRAFT_996023 [Russula vinacea]|nr:hypothetical protein BJV77DRAFT_996023 [Russula vinacea]